MNDDVWVQPPDAPIFEPTDEEFKDPLKYMETIFPIVYNTGIAKIKPPSSWCPPFALDPENFKFTPRVQRICEMDAKSRAKLNFMSELNKYWEINNVKLKYPVIEQKYLDLLALKKFVMEEGGYEHVTKKKMWAHIAFLLGVDVSKAQSLKNHYDRIIKPYDKFLAENESAASEGSSKPKKIAIASRSRNVSRRYSRRIADTNFDKCDVQNNPELRKLQFYGPGPKMADSSLAPEESDGKKGKFAMAKLQTTACSVCGTASQDRLILTCSMCSCGFHTFCLDPPIREIPKSEWHCQKCLVKVVKAKSNDPFGFEQSPSEYNIRTFGEFADSFKRSYFNRAPSTVPHEEVEQEFWRLVSTLEEDVSVMYGADLQTFELGSGFPTLDNNVQVDSIDYANSGWNLNNMPLESRSLMRFIEAKISGMKLPWLYIGMCFSAFCWHVEDHWSYSINYLHWGEAKTWYGVPSKDAEKLEQAVRSSAPELFENQPDLMHHLVTTMSPVTLMNHGVNVYRLMQCAGEFVITLPRAYHAGFNQGYNCAEAVNFCLPNWISMGRDCLQHYRTVKRYNVFCHDELIAKIVESGEKFDADFAQNLHDDLACAVSKEETVRSELADAGVESSCFIKFEAIADDLRVCEACDITCFYSAMTCTCSPGKLVCLNDHNKLCECPYSSKTLQYRYTLDEMKAMRDKMLQRVETCTDWYHRTTNGLEAWPGSKLTVSEFKELVDIAKSEDINEPELLEKLKQAVSDAEQVQLIAQQLAAKKHRTRVRTGGVVNSTTNELGQHQQSKLTLDELQAFLDQVQTIPCELPETEQIIEVIDCVESLHSDIAAVLESRSMSDVDKLEKLYEKAIELDVEITNCNDLKAMLEAANWLKLVEEKMRDEQIEIDDLKMLIDKFTLSNSCAEVTEKLEELINIHEKSLEWEIKAQYCLQSSPKYTIEQLELIINDANELPTYLPTVSSVQESLRKAKEWVAKVDALLNCDPPPYLSVVEGLAAKGKILPVQLSNHGVVQALLDAAQDWREKSEKLFLKSNNSDITLMDVLTPRGNLNMRSRGGAAKSRRKTDVLYRIADYSFEEPKPPAHFAKNYKDVSVEEQRDMKELRWRNIGRSAKDDDNKELYCICRRTYSGFMLQCDLCRDWFHTTCVPLPKSIAYKVQGRSSVTALTEAIKDLKYLCPMCKRSRRPRLESVVSLLACLEEIPLRLVEGEALQCLFERAMRWRKKTRDFFASQEKLKTALTRMAMKKPPETIYPVLNPKTENFENNSSEDETCEHVLKKEVDVKVDLDSYSWLEHGTEAILESNNESAVQACVKSEVADKTIYVEGLPVMVSERDLEVMEDLLLEGDLIEIGLDETHYLWTVLQAATTADEEDVEEEGDMHAIETVESKHKEAVNTAKTQAPETLNFKSEACRPVKRKNVADSTKSRPRVPNK